MIFVNSWRQRWFSVEHHSSISRVETNIEHQHWCIFLNIFRFRMFPSTNYFSFCLRSLHCGSTTLSDLNLSAPFGFRLWSKCSNAELPLAIFKLLCPFEWLSLFYFKMQYSLIISDFAYLDKGCLCLLIGLPLSYFKINMRSRIESAAYPVLFAACLEYLGVVLGLELGSGS